MKTKLWTCLLAVVVIFLASGRTEAMELAVDGRVVSSAVQVKDGVSYAPLRQVLAGLGEWEVTWDNAIRTAKAKGELFTLAFPVGSRTALVDGYAFDLGAPIYLYDHTTYVPVRAAANLAGAEAVWNGREKPITLVPRTTYRGHSAEDFYWLSRIISAESQGEPLLGQLAVGHVVLNRVEDAQFPSTIKEVIFDTQYAVQFEPVANGSVYWEPTARSVLAAKMVLNGTRVVDRCLYFYAPALSEGTWISQNRTYYTTIGCHKFYL